MGKKNKQRNKQNKQNKQNNGNNRDDNDSNNHHDHDNDEIEEMLRQIEESANRVKEELINRELTRKVSSLRSVNGSNNKKRDANQGNNQILEQLMTKEVGGTFPTQCMACRRRLFGQE